MYIACARAFVHTLKSEYVSLSLCVSLYVCVCACLLACMQAMLKGVTYLSGCGPGGGGGPFSTTDIVPL